MLQGVVSEHCQNNTGSSIILPALTVARLVNLDEFTCCGKILIFIIWLKLYFGIV